MISDDAKNERSTIYQVLEQARASLIDPQRPTTPAESMRRSLFAGEDYRPESRPTSAFHLDGSSTSEAFHMDDDFKYDDAGTDGICSAADEARNSIARPQRTRMAA